MSNGDQLRASQARACYKRGRAYSTEGDNERAIAEFTRAIRLNPSYARAYGRRAVAYFHNNEYVFAIHDFGKVLELAPNNVQAHFCRGQLLEAVGQYAMAIVDYTAVIGMQPSHVKAHVYRGLAYFMAGQNDLALKDLNNAMGLDASDPELIAARAIVFTRNFEPQKAAFNHFLLNEIAPDLYAIIRPALSAACPSNGKKRSILDTIDDTHASAAGACTRTVSDQKFRFSMDTDHDGLATYVVTGQQEPRT